MDDIIEQIALCIEKGKISAASNHPAEMKGQPGADELTKRALEKETEPGIVLKKGLIKGMEKVGRLFRNNEIFLPDVLMAAKAMTAAMEHLRPHFQSGKIRHQGIIVLGTVAGDLHDIGKKIVGMFFEGGGWDVIDLGVDVKSDMFLKTVEEYQPRAVGLSALLTTTMVNMEKITEAVKGRFPKVKVIVGGAPLTESFAAKIGADAYFPDPQGSLEYLDGVLLQEGSTGESV
ncbi:MAG: cobalamin-dependent protein [Candidatus Aminicenantes bacterium]|nr:cobalamin-dependent protein [Candidatus Aminicenantes bacterium]